MMENEEIAQLMTGIQHELADLRTQVEQLANRIPEQYEESVPVSTTNDVSDADTSNGMSDLLSALGSAGGLELLGSLLGGNGKKIASIAPLIGMLQGGQDSGAGKLMSALGEMGPDMQKAASKLQTILPVVQAVSKSPWGISAKRKVKPLGSTQRRWPSTNSSMNQADSLAVDRSLQSLQPVTTQDWGAWSISNTHRH